jgi:cytidylate kinase
MSRSIDQLVNEQFQRWMKEQSAAGKKLSATKKTAPQQPMIVFSREYGGRGAEVGRAVAERLRFQFHGQELVHEVARKARVRQQLVESLDERAQDGIEQWVTEMMEGGVFAPSDYLRNLSRVIVALGRHGRGVIIGRGAHFILEPTRTLRVRAIAPLEVRVARIADREDMSSVEARALVLRVDSERTAFYRQHFNVDVSDPHHYDLLINTHTLPIDACADMVIRAFKARFAR